MLHGRFLLLVTVVLGAAVLCSCDEPAVDSGTQTVSERPAAPPPPPPPPPAAPAADDPDSATTAPDPAAEPAEEEGAAEEPGATDDGAEAGEEEEPEPDLPIADQPERELTVDEAVTALEELGARVGRDDSGNVVKVFLNRTQITDQQLWPIKYLPTVEIVNFTATQITNAGLEHLKSLPNLQRIYPAKSSATEEGLNQLKLAMPGLQVAL